MVKRKIIKLFVVFGALIFIFSLSGCLDDIHIHEYQLIVDSTEHYYICECGNVKNKSIHDYDLVVDKEPTIEEDGIVHMECVVCGYKEYEGTVIEAGLPQIEAKCTNFSSGNELKLYLLEHKIKCLYVNKIRKQNEVIICYDDFYNRYTINFDRKDGEFVNPYVKIRIALYSDYLGNDSLVGDGSPPHSITFLFKLWEYDGTNKLKYEFEDNLIYIYSGDKLVGEVSYNEVLGVSQEWITEFLNENLMY